MDLAFALLIVSFLTTVLGGIYYIWTRFLVYHVSTSLMYRNWTWDDRQPYERAVQWVNYRLAEQKVFNNLVHSRYIKYPVRSLNEIGNLAFTTRPGVYWLKYHGAWLCISIDSRLNGGAQNAQDSVNPLAVMC